MRPVRDGFANVMLTMRPHSLHTLSVRLTDASAFIAAPIPAAERVKHRPFLQMVKSQWNTQIETLFHGVGDLNRKAFDWSQRTLYGRQVDSKKD